MNLGAALSTNLVFQQRLSLRIIQEKNCPECGVRNELHGLRLEFCASCGFPLYSRESRSWARFGESL